MSKHDEKNVEALLDQTVGEIRGQRLSDEQVAESTRKVWDKLGSSGLTVSAGPRGDSPPRIRNCSDLQALIPDYLSGRLSESRRLLLEDHLNECVPCRRALRVAREGKLPARNFSSPARRSAWKWGTALSAAAAVVLVVALAWWGSFDEWLPAPQGARATVESVEGTLFRVSSEGSLPIAPGTELGEGDEIRTARLSSAVLRLRDGSRVELDQRAQLTLRESRAGRQLLLERGNIIVEAAQQRQGNLAVLTDDCKVTVQGTVFTVNHGTRGSRVSVLEGQVAVSRLGRRETLGPGQQYASRETLRQVPLAREVAWSSKAPEHLELVRQLNVLGQEIESSFRSEARNSASLLNLAPGETVIYVAIPNLTEAVSESMRMFQQRLDQSPELQQWWAERSAEMQPRLEVFLDRLTELGRHLGDEVAVAVPLEENKPGVPLILAEASGEAGLEAALRREVDRINAEAGQAVLALVEDPFAEPPGIDGMLLMVRRGIFAASPSLARLQELAQRLDSGSASPFVDSPFYSRVAEAYFEGVGYLLAIDVQSLIASEMERSSDGEGRALFDNLGLTDVRDVLIERQSVGDLTETRAEVSFAQARRGLASWLAEPAPMGALDFVSADAKVAAAFVVKEPQLMVEDLFGLLAVSDSNAWQELVQFQLDEGINIQQDFAAPLGGEIAFALDGPVLPQPSWKMVLEVYDPARLQRTIEWALTKVNERLAADGEAPLELLVQGAGGRTFYSLVMPGHEQQLHYVFVDGYLVAAPNRPLLLNAIGYRQTGYTLTRSAAFLERLPADRYSNFSALVFQDVGSLLEPLAAGISNSSEELPEEARLHLQQLAGQLQSSLFYAYAEQERITLAGTGDSFTPFGISGGLGGFLGLTQLMSDIR